jgi:hypothetical protein
MTVMTVTAAKIKQRFNPITPISFPSPAAHSAASGTVRQQLTFLILKTKNGPNTFEFTVHSTSEQQPFAFRAES